MTELTMNPNSEDTKPPMFTVRRIVVIILFVIAAAFVFLGPGSIQVDYTATNQTAEQSAMQQELFDGYTAELVSVEQDGDKNRYTLSDGTWSHVRPSFLDDNDQVFMDDFDQQLIADQLLTDNVPFWMFSGDALSVRDYNAMLVATKFALWVVFLSMASWLICRFLANDIDSENGKGSVGGALMSGLSMVGYGVFPILLTGFFVWNAFRAVQPMVPIAVFFLFALPLLWLYRDDLRQALK